ncbi:MAG: hypothetical protein OEZ01_09030 [Candidatus Heimdallarchaeota archaeon]|nr:hypothetical protein [Candidatus Heimdallarchaeota archaeon]MDH5646137.1 hypothetical protein [Candidatus Heimdallarchaeota archaeon]
MIVQAIQQILQKYFSNEITLNHKLHYYRYNNNNTQVYSFSFDEINTMDNAINGMVILIVQNKKIVIVPSIINCIEKIFPELVVSESKLNKIIFGKSILLNDTNKIAIVKDPKNRLVGFGVGEAGTFTPLIDLGGYLRIE